MYSGFVRGLDLLWEPFLIYFSCHVRLIETFLRGNDKPFGELGVFLGRFRRLWWEWGPFWVYIRPMDNARGS